MAGKSEKIKMVARDINRTLKASLGIADGIVIVNITPKKLVASIGSFIITWR